MEAVLQRWKTSRADALLAVGLVLLCAVEIDGDLYPSRLHGVLLVVPVLSLAWRNRWPAPVALVVLGTEVVAAAVSTHQYPPQMPLLAVVLAVYTVAAQLTGRAAVLAGAATLALVEAAHVASRDGEVEDFLPLLVWGASWAAGRLVRHRTLEAAEAGRRAAEAVARKEQDTREAVTEERDRIARELHDVVAHAVSLMVVQAGAERLALGADAPRTRAALEAVEQAGREALAELRTMLAVLRSDEDLDAGRRAPRPDLAALPALVRRVQEAGTPVRCAVTGDVAGVPPGLALSAYRVAQEALTNALRHAPGEPVDLRVEIDDDGVRIEARNPLPAVPGQSGAGRGLVGIRERALLHGGTSSAGRSGRTWLLDVRLPLPSHASVTR